MLDQLSSIHGNGAMRVECGALAELTNGTEVHREALPRSRLIDSPFTEVHWKPAAPNDQYDTIRLIHASFCLQEFKRAEFLSRGCESKLMTFLHFWARLRKAELDSRGLHSANNMPFSAAYDNRQVNHPCPQFDHHEDGFASSDYLIAF